MNIFVYGTLMHDEVTLALVGKKFRKTPAVLKGYFVSKIANRAAPGMVVKKDTEARGFILSDVDEESIAVIDVWETNDYIAKQVIPKESKEACSAYIWKGDITGEPWSDEEYLNNHLQQYLETDIPNFLKNYQKIS